MLVEIRAKNCFSFYNSIVFSLEADMRNKKFSTNVHKDEYFNVLKTAGIYGQNNSGKTCLVKCIKAMKDIILRRKNSLLPNIFYDNSLCELGVSFLFESKEYSYDIIYDYDKKTYPYEKFKEIAKDKYGNKKESVWLLKDYINNAFSCESKELTKLMPIIAQSDLLFYQIESDKFSWLSEMKRILTSFASKIDIINMNNIPLEKTISLLKNRNDIQNKVVDFIKNADLYLDDFKYEDDTKIAFSEEMAGEKADEAVLDIPEKIMDQIKLVSVYKKHAVPSILFDSTGTKKFAALAGYIIEGLEEGRILVVDELDSSLHFKLTRAIVAMFNNELNQKSQLIFTVHDINLMDCKKLLRKEQIWFIHKDENNVYLYSLAEFTAEKGVRDTSDIVNKYQKGLLGALPEPEFIKSLLEINRIKRLY